MALGKLITYALITFNTDGEEIILSDLVIDPKQLTELPGNHKNETIICVTGDNHIPYMEWNSDRYEWQLVN